MRTDIRRIRSKPSPNPYKQFEVNPAIVAKAVFRYLVKATSFPVYKPVKITPEFILTIDRLSLAITAFRKVQTRREDFIDWRRLDLNHFLNYYAAGRADEIDFKDATKDLQQKYGYDSVKFDERIVLDILETIDDCENRCNRLRYFRHRNEHT
jgi:hypothetical protein